MEDFILLLPTKGMDFWKIENEEMTVTIKWSHDYFEDYKLLSYRYYECGNVIFEEVFRNRNDNLKVDRMFIAGIFLMRHSIELGLKALLCRVCSNKKDLQNSIRECCHDISKVFKKCIDTKEAKYLTNNEKDWLIKYLNSVEYFDKQSDLFRFPFKREFLSVFGDKFIENESVVRNLSYAFTLVKKCIEKGDLSEEEKLYIGLKPDFLIFTHPGTEYCCFWKEYPYEGFYPKIIGYSLGIKCIYENQQISNETKVYPILFMLRNVLELTLKRMFSNIKRSNYNITLIKFNSKLKSHHIKKDLWKYIEPVIRKIAIERNEDLEILDHAEKMIDVINDLDKNSDKFRYPTSNNLDYCFDNKIVDIHNICVYFRSLINFLNGCDCMVGDIDLKNRYD